MGCYECLSTSAIVGEEKQAKLWTIICVGGEKAARIQNYVNCTK